MSAKLIQDLHAGISRRDWSSVEAAANRLRDEVDKTVATLAGTGIGSLPNDYPLSKLAADLLSEAETRETEARAKALEEAALWHDAQVQSYTDQITENSEYLTRIGKALDSRANEYCDDQRSTHRRSAAHLRSMAGRAALERSEG
ncbi:hypothetical protein [Agrobacterium pusense]|uniref:hypothetical protein n=1 Tax=Agrobacterium pusense TaxID=648995 RepID=UPI0010ADF539|nr:hypothetical protein [Agrobacterium pusense]WCK26590.1 hypothetical protein CFBP5496_0020535 [Agrobacterium pusense]